MGVHVEMVWTYDLFNVKLHLIGEEGSWESEGISLKKLSFLLVVFLCMLDMLNKYLS